MCTQTQSNTDWIHSCHALIERIIVNWAADEKKKKIICVFSFRTMTYILGVLETCFPKPFLYRFEDFGLDYGTIG